MTQQIQSPEADQISDSNLKTQQARPIPARKPSVTFRNDCIFIDNNPLSIAENGIKRKVSLPGRHPSPTLDKLPGTKKRLSLSILPSPPKFRLPRKWSNGPMSATFAQTPPRISTRNISAPISLPTSPVVGWQQDNDLFKRIKSEVDLPHATLTPEGNDEEEVLSPGELFASQSGSTLAQSGSMEMSTLDTPRSINLADDTDVRVGQVPSSRPILHIAPEYSPCASIPRRSTTLPLNTSTSDLDILHEGQEVHHSSKGHSPLISPTSCRGIWLCSQPRTPISPTVETSTAPPPAYGMIRSISGPGNFAPTAYSAGKRGRPFVTRSSSTGRLAHEFDEEGRIICLSVHSDRILKPKQLPSA